MLVETKTVLVIFPHYYGKGADIADAIKETKKAGYSHRKGTRKSPARVVFFSCDPADVKIEGDWCVRWSVPQGTTIMATNMALA